MKRQRVGGLALSLILAASRRPSAGHGGAWNHEREDNYDSDTQLCASQTIPGAAPSHDAEPMTILARAVGLTLLGLSAWPAKTCWA